MTRHNIACFYDTNAPLAELPEVSSHRSRTNTYSCEVCFRIPRVKIRCCVRCNARVCHPCFKSWLHVRVDAAMVHNLCCISCTEPVSEEELLDICGENTLRKYRYFRSKYAHRNNPFAAWCPREGCWCLLSDVIKHLPFSVQEFSCPDCNLKICRRCISESHEDGICPIPTATITHNALVRLWQTLHTKKCPVCSVRIERAGGCSQMRCASCQTKFCWRCRGVLVTVRNPHQRVTHRCICPRLNSTITWISLAGGIVVGVPVALAAAVVAGPPALVVYLALPSRKKRDIRGEMFSFFQRL